MQILTAAILLGSVVLAQDQPAATTDTPSAAAATGDGCAQYGDNGQAMASCMDVQGGLNTAAASYLAEQAMKTDVYLAAVAIPTPSSQPDDSTQIVSQINDQFAQVSNEPTQYQSLMSSVYGVVLSLQNSPAAAATTGLADTSATITSSMATVTGSSMSFMNSTTLVSATSGAANGTASSGNSTVGISATGSNAAKTVSSTSSSTGVAAQARQTGLAMGALVAGVAGFAMVL